MIALLDRGPSPTLHVMWLDGRAFVRWRVVLAIAALAVAGGVLATVAVEELAFSDTRSFDVELDPAVETQRIEPEARLRAVAVSTTALLAIGLAIGVAWSSWVVVRTLLACTILGWINCAAALTLHALTSGEPGPMGGGALGAFLGGLCFGVFFGAPLGLLYGAVSSFATKRLRRLLDRPTLSSTWDASFTVGVTVLGSAAFATLIAAARRDAIVAWYVPCAMALAGALVALIANLRARWLRRLRDDPGRAGLERLALVDLGVEADALLPLHDGVQLGAAHALVRVLAPHGPGAYREARTRVAVALVD